MGVSESTTLMIVIAFITKVDLKEALGSSSALNSDSISYTDDVYYQLAAEYQDDLPTSPVQNDELIENTQLQDINFQLSYSDKKGPGHRHNSADVPAESDEDKQTSNKASIELIKANSEEDEISARNGGEESYAEMASRLNCDNPWFWNTFKCTWIDVKANNVIKRTERNGRKAAWILGTVLAILLVWICSVYCLYSIRLRNRNNLNKLREKYIPGQIVLPNGSVQHYQPNREEIEAYEDLIKAIIVQEI